MRRLPQAFHLHSQAGSGEAVSVKNRKIQRCRTVKALDDPYILSQDSMKSHFFSDAQGTAFSVE